MLLVRRSILQCRFIVDMFGVYVKRKNRTVSLILIYGTPILIGFTVLCLGWGVMRILWEIDYKSTYRGVRSFPYYLSANWGDSLILPVVCALISFEMWRFRNSVKWIPVAIAGLFGLLAGVISQFEWTHSNHTTLNWTFTPQGSFNLPGWYHAFFLSVMCGNLSGGVVAMLSLGRDRIRWERGSVLRYFVVGYLLVLFTCLLATDNKRSLQGIAKINVSVVISVVSMPILSTIIMIVMGVVCRGRWRILVPYSIVLLTTSIVVPLALLMRGIVPVSGSEIFCCGTAALFALTFVTAPATSSLIEQLVRSLPAAIVTLILALATPGVSDNLSWMRVVVYSIVAMIIIDLMILPSCIFDASKKAAESFYAAASSALLVTLVAFSSVVQRSTAFADGLLSTFFPFFITLMAGWWIKGNFGAVISRESVVAVDDYVDSSENNENGVFYDVVSRERLLRYKVLMGFAIHAGCVMLFLVWTRLALSVANSATSVWRVALCSMLVVIMTEGSFVFSRLSFRDNIFVLRGLVMGGADVLRVYVGAGLVAVLSAGYGVSIAIMSSTKTTLIGWCIMLVVYALSMFAVCALVLYGVPGVGRKEWPCVSSPWAAVGQDHMVSLMMLNVFGVGIPVWISDRLVNYGDAFLVCGMIMVPLAGVFLFFLNNNIGHIEREKNRVETDVAGDSSVDLRRGSKYLENLERHCLSQNRTAAVIVFFSLSGYFLIEVVGEFTNIRNSEGILGLRRMLGGGDWPSPPQL